MAAFTPSRHRGPSALPLRAAALCLLVAACLLPPYARAAAPSPPGPVAVQVTVGSTPTSEPLPAGFLGFSVEYGALRAYLGPDPNALDPVFLALLQGVAQGQFPVLRVGGNSTDETWVPLPGVLPPVAVTNVITPDWLSTVHALVAATGARLILGVNLAANDPQIASVEARALLDGVGRKGVSALEIGNEPDLYPRVPWYELPNGVEILRRLNPYPLGRYLGQLTRWAGLVPQVPLAIGALATTAWLPALIPVAHSLPRVAFLTVHRYPLSHCGVSPSSPNYPTVANLLSPAATTGLAAPLAAPAAALRAEGVNLRVDELNSASCEGAPGVSNTFASALWVLETLDDLAAAGVDGVNIHTLPGAAYAPFSFRDHAGHWTGVVAPLYYGLLAFCAGFPPGAVELASTDSSTVGSSEVSATATLAPDGRVATTIVNADASTPAAVTLTLPTSPPLTVETLTAPSLTATTGVTLGGASFGPSTSTGRLGPPATTTLLPSGGAYSFTVPPASAVILATAAP
ncbi:glycosyl hydrolase family 79 C-terminal domain-containing protein [Conexibacter sp. DBS9H8]|uniref:glycosyl hydrolase family 79 C-terminal domain-containing protein n=1 Tax=Conexibacter sp. DBS9H8 TaxID=2937801 RepID=UPI00200D2908|nr:glycosyl hydrolase family 79 C-terminal domain-containing protein [Conexibacter sp. DBS9H8]